LTRSGKRIAAASATVPAAGKLKLTLRLSRKARTGKHRLAVTFTSGAAHVTKTKTLTIRLTR
jgi:hypothetical protein